LANLCHRYRAKISAEFFPSLGAFKEVKGEEKLGAFVNSYAPTETFLGVGKDSSQKLTDLGMREKSEQF
jgi:hypothetical protein